MGKKTHRFSLSTGSYGISSIKSTPWKKINTGTQPCRFGSDEFPFQWGDFLGSSLQPLIFRVYLHIHRPFRFSLAVLAEAQPLAFWQGTITHPTWREKCVKITSQISIGFFWGFFFQSRHDLFISTCMYMYIYIYTYTYIRFCKLSTIFTWLSIWRCFCFFCFKRKSERPRKIPAEFPKSLKFPDLRYCESSEVQFDFHWKVPAGCWNAAAAKSCGS